MGIFFATGLPTAWAEPGGFLPLKIRFWADEVELTGAVPNQKTANLLLITLHRSHPDLRSRNRLVIDPARTVINLPDSRELAGLLLELALSTKDGSLQVTNREVTVSGLTDSLVTHAAFEARLESLAEHHPERRWSNRICLVHEDDLAPGLLPKRPRPALDPEPLENAPVVLAESAYGPLPPMRARPVQSIGLTENAVAIAPPGDAPTVPASNSAEPVETSHPMEPAEQIRFTANSFLVAFDQYRLVDAATERIRSLPPEAGPIILRAYPDTAGRHTYNEWLSNSRARAVRRAFVDAGFPEERFRIETPDGRDDSKGLGTVRIFVPRMLPPAAEPLPEDEGAPSEATENLPVTTASAAALEDEPPFPTR